MSWYGAKAYAKWRRRRLPKEQEWEKAARGIGGRIYPWGNEFDSTRCNTKESGNEKTTPVDRYSKGVSPFGCFDMAGNVWEWTDSWSESEKYKTWKTKVLRGGSWGLYQGNARCAADFGRLVRHGRGYSDGFRCARDLK